MAHHPPRRACQVAIVGAGPYGLSLAAHLRDRGVDFRIFGRPMDLWRHHMPKNMMLKSEGFGSNLSTPRPGFRLKDYCRRFGEPYADEGLPVPLDTFIAYADWFRARQVPDLEETMVTRIEKRGDVFDLTLETGEEVEAQHVVLAVGITWFAHLPGELAALPAALASHSYDHRTVDQFAGREVVVLGAGASAVNLAHELHEVGARVSLLARGQQIEYHTPPDKRAATPFAAFRKPASPIGPGWQSFFCSYLSDLFYRLPATWRRRAIRSHMRPAAGWFMQDKVEQQVPALLGRAIKAATEKDGRVQLRLSDDSKIACDHVFAATGFRTHLNRLAFLSDDLRARMAHADCAMHVASNFETNVPGLYAVGPMAMENFGPLLRFMAGSDFASRRLTATLHRRIVRGQWRAVFARALGALRSARPDTASESV